MIQKTVLENGVTVISAGFPHLKSVSLGFWIRSGTRHESSQHKGLAHFLEHMAFKGTPQKTALEIARDFERMGAQVNAYTSREVTAYHARVLDIYFEDVFYDLAHIIHDSVFPEAEMVKEKNVVLQELADAEDTPDDIIFDYAQDMAFAQQSLGWSILGTKETLESLTKDDLNAHIKATYTGENIIIAAAGPLKHARLVALAEKAFGHIEKGPRNEVPKGFYVGGTQHEQRDLQQQHVVLGYEGLALNDPRFYTLSVLGALLGGGMSSRLFEEIREKHGLAYSVYTFNSSFEDTGLFGVYLGTQGKDAQKALDVTCHELKNLSTTLNDDEILRAKNQVKTSLVLAYESPFYTIESSAQHLFYFDQIFSLDYLMAAIDGVSKEKIIDLSGSLFSGAPTLVTLGPLKAGSLGI